MLAAYMWCVTLLLSMIGSCVSTSESQLGYGVAAEAIAYIPARISIFPCLPWPEKLSYRGQSWTTVRESAGQALCERVDAFVEQGFANQPYMRGYSRRFVAQSLAAAGLNARDPLQLWAKLKVQGPCPTCLSAPTAYSSLVATQSDWLAWLARYSAASNYSDAVLLPFVTHAYERAYDDRGLVVHERGIGVALLLIDTASGQLLWAGGRSTVVPNKRLAAQTKKDAALPFPDWEFVWERILTSALWLEFPGRQPN